MENAAAIFSIAVRFQVPICVGCTPYFFDNSASVISSRIASSATLALKSGEWFFRVFILDRLSHKSIHLNYWSEFLRPPLAIDAKLLVLDEPTLGLDIIYRKRFYRRLLDDYMTDGRTLLITTHQVDEIEYMLTDIMFLHDGEIILDSPMDDIGQLFAQLIVGKDMMADAEKLGPIYSETRFDQTVMIFQNRASEGLEPLGRVSTPSLSDLFVTLMQRQVAIPGAA